MDIIHIYTSNSPIEKAIIDIGFKNNNIDYYISDDSSMLLGQPAYQIYINEKYLSKSIEILKTLHVRRELSDDFDIKKLDDLYKQATNKNIKSIKKEKRIFLYGYILILVKASPAIAFVILFLLLKYNVISFSNNDSERNYILLITSIIYILLFIAIKKFFPNKNKT